MLKVRAGRIASVSSESGSVADAALAVAVRVTCAPGDALAGTMVTFEIVGAWSAANSGEARTSFVVTSLP